MTIKTVGVIGAGLMGSGISQVIAQSGLEVIMRDIETQFVEKGLTSIKKNLKRNVEKAKMTQEEADSVLSRIKGTTGLAEVSKGADFIIEAVSENMDLKRTLFKELDRLCPANVIFASNTSSFSISEMASVTARPDKFLGLHFFSPAHILKLVEMIRGFYTSDETMNVGKDLMEKIGKEPILLKDSTGFVVNRIYIPMLNEAMFALMEGVGSREDIDKGLKLGVNVPVGPLELADLIGLDIVLAVMERLYTDFGDPKYRPCPLLKQMVRSGILGRKSGAGFYEYNNGK